jgi:hypothetical protein
MKNQRAFEEYAFPVWATAGTSYAVRFGIHRFIHSKTLPYRISTGSKPIFGHRSARSSRKRFSSSDWLPCIVIVASTQVSRSEVAFQDHVFANPGISHGGVVPEVRMSVDSQRGFDPPH